MLKWKLQFSGALNEYITCNLSAIDFRFNLRGRNITNRIDCDIIIEIASARVMTECLACIFGAAREQCTQLIRSHVCLQSHNPQLCVLIELMRFRAAQQLIVAAWFQSHVLLVCFQLHLGLLGLLLVLPQLQQIGKAQVLECLQFVGTLWSVCIGEQHMEVSYT